MHYHMMPVCPGCRRGILSSISCSDSPMLHGPTAGAGGYLDVGVCMLAQVLLLLQPRLQQLLLSLPALHPLLHRLLLRHGAHA